jgi:acyl carrier protein
MTFVKKVQLAGLVGLSLTSCLTSLGWAEVSPGAPAGSTADANAGGNAEARITKILHEHLGVPVSKITPDAKLMKDLGADSLDVVDLIMAMEEEFAIEISDDECDKWVYHAGTVGDVIDTVKSAPPETSYRTLKTPEPKKP